MENIFLQYSWVFALILLWTLPWKAVALWKAARRAHLGWFVALVILNTLGILDIIYILVFSKRTKKPDLAPQTNQFQRPDFQNSTQKPTV